MNLLLPISDLLMNLGFNMPSKCPFCEHIETTIHVFYDCLVVHAIWQSMFSLLGILFPSSLNLWDFFNLCWTRMISFIAEIVLRLLPAVGMWEIWKS